MAGEDDYFVAIFTLDGVFHSAEKGHLVFLEGFFSSDFGRYFNHFVKT